MSRMKGEFPSAIPDTGLKDLPMRVGLGQFNEATDERLQYIKQCGSAGRLTEF